MSFSLSPSDLSGHLALGQGGGPWAKAERQGDYIDSGFLLPVLLSLIAINGCVSCRPVFEKFMKQLYFGQVCTLKKKN
jgi:hypothetical protein